MKQLSNTLHFSLLCYLGRVANMCFAHFSGCMTLAVPELGCMPLSRTAAHEKTMNEFVLLSAISRPHTNHLSHYAELQIPHEHSITCSSQDWQTDGTLSGMSHFIVFSLTLENIINPISFLYCVDVQYLLESFGCDKGLFLKIALRYITASGIRGQCILIKSISLDKKSVQCRMSSSIFLFYSSRRERLYFSGSLKVLT